jgi:hypothetical protein
MHSSSAPAQSEIQTAFDAEGQPHVRARLAAQIQQSFHDLGVDLFPPAWTDLLVEVVLVEKALTRVRIAGMVSAGEQLAGCHNDKGLIARMAEGILIHHEAPDGEITVPLDGYSEDSIQ